MANVLLGVTGSVAATLTPQMRAALRSAGHEVRVAATEASRYFFDPDGLDPIHFDADEWPRADAEVGAARYSRGDPVLHIELRKWADILLVAPLDANTLAKLAMGLSDNLLTCVYRAWDFSRRIVLAPAMNTLMWESPITRRHLRMLAGDHARPGPAPDFPSAAAGSSAAAEAVNRLCPNLRIVLPVEKTLACGDVGVGAMAAIPDIVAAVGADPGQDPR